MCPKCGTVNFVVFDNFTGKRKGECLCLLCGAKGMLRSVYEAMVADNMSLLISK